MADAESDIVQETVLMDRAIWRKWNKFTWSGLLLVLAGLVLIGAGAALNQGAYSITGIFIGIGALVVIAGIIRALIGLINPLSPTDLRGIDVPQEEIRVEE